MPNGQTRAAAALTLMLALAPAAPGQGEPHQEWVEDYGALIPEHVPRPAGPRVRLERLSTAVPWPRGLAWIDGELAVLARGRHRRAGGLDPAVEDHAGTIFIVDPDVAEPADPDTEASPPVRGNGRVLARPSSPPFLLYDHRSDPIDARLVDRPYCTLLYDEVSRNLFICGYSGVDLPGARFLKNATDSVHRLDLRDGRWHAVELHDHAAAPATGPEAAVMSSAAFPHHDPARHRPPHGWVNGANGGCVAGGFLYIAGKDNHVIVQYDLAGIRRDPGAGPPESRVVLEREATVSHPRGTRTMELLGPSALAARDGFLYVGCRTSSLVVRFPLDEHGDLVEPVKGQLIAVFEPWDPARGRSANLVDLAFSPAGELHVSCAQEGRVWNVGAPDPARPFYGNDRTARPTTAPPLVDLPELLGGRTACGNIAFDGRGRLYVTSGSCASGGHASMGVVYRASTID